MRSIYWRKAAAAAAPSGPSILVFGSGPAARIVFLRRLVHSFDADKHLSLLLFVQLLVVVATF